MKIRALADSIWFNASALTVILISAVLLGVDTYVSPGTPGQRWVDGLLMACVVLFIVEIAVKFMARESTRAFFSDGWNIFDLVIIIAALVPERALGDLGPVVPVLRILRVLRVLRLVRTIPELRLIVNVLGRSIVSMKWIGLLAIIGFYVFGIIGQKLFGAYQTEYATLHESLFTLFRVLTGDDWTQLRYEAREKVQSTQLFVTAFYVMWILIGTFILINLIVGAIINNYQEVQEIERAKGTKLDISEQRLKQLVDELQQILKARDAMGRNG